MNQPINQSIDQTINQSNQSINQSINQPINQSINRSKKQSINQSTNQANQSSNQPTSQPINQPMNQSANQPINQPPNQPINQSTNQPIKQSTNQPTNQPINPSITQSINQIKSLIYIYTFYWIWYAINWLLFVFPRGYCGNLHICRAPCRGEQPSPWLWGREGLTKCGRNKRNGLAQCFYPRLSFFMMCLSNLTMNIRTFHLDWTNNTDFWLRKIQSPYDLTRRWCLMLS